MMVYSQKWAWVYDICTYHEKTICCILGHYIQTFVQISSGAKGGINQNFIENICKSEIFVRFPGAIQQAFIQQTGAAEYRRHVKPLAHM